MFQFLNSTAARLVTGFLVIQSVLLYSSIRPEFIPNSRPLRDFPRQVGPWTTVMESEVDKETMDVLKADDTLNRVYRDSAGNQPSFFIASFRTQRTGKAPHSPKNCLPGSGWTQLSSENYSIDMGSPAPIVVNRYIIVHGQDREMVMYWYQSRDRVVADEFKAKFWVVADAMRLNRTDTALVRVILPVVNNDEASATRIGSEFVRAVFPTIREYLPQ